MATGLNPSFNRAPSKQPLATYPNGIFPDPSAPPPTGNGVGVLQHAPYSFRTLTGGSGAIAYLNNEIINVIGSGGLPVNVGDETYLRWVVIHCLPGLYGPDLDPQAVAFDDFDDGSRLRFNGETFPVQLPKGVSLQGTSALDTIFDGRFGTAPIIVTGGSIAGGDVADPQDYFIDSLTIRNSVSDGLAYDEGPFAPNNWSGTGIYIGREDADIPLTVSNCFITDNAVGIAIEGDVDFAPSPKIFNNTLAFNRIGLWSGDRNGTGTNGAGAGVATPTVMNNIFDTRRPDDPNELQRRPFLGLHPDDLTVATIQVTSTTFLVSGQSFNAWHAGQEDVADTAGNVVTNYPQPDLRTPAPFPSPEVDIAPYMGSATAPRGILYVADAFRASGVGDISPHDFRLSPHVATDPGTIDQGSPISAINPMVSRGLDLGDSTVRFLSFTMANGNVISRAPGIEPTAASEDPYVFQAWDWDCEGFGNPRIRCRAGFADPPSVLSRIDLGADEMDDLIMAGYLPSTRMFAVRTDLDGTIRDAQTECYFFDLRGATYDRPRFSGQLGQTYNWWLHSWWQTVAEGCPDCVDLTIGTNPLATNFTTTRRANGTATLRSSLITSLTWLTLPPAYGLKHPIMRNLECDFSPHLISDWHHLWGGGWFTTANFPNIPPISMGSPPDIYASNPWFGDSAISNADSLARAVDNWHLYSNPTHPNPPYNSDVLEGTLNSPGAFLNGPRVECGSLPPYLLPFSPTLVFGPYAPCTGSSSTTYGVGIFGFGDSAAGCPDVLPLIAQWLGARYNCQREETQAATRSNLQTFLTVIGDEPFVQPPTGPAAGRSYSYPGSRVEIDAALPDDSPRRALERVLQRGRNR